jgi:hypothetical protein
MDLDTALREADPARGSALPGPESAAAARLYQQITAPPPGRAVRRRPHVSGRLVAGVAAAGLAVVAAVALLPGPPWSPGSHTGSPRGFAPAAAVLLAQAAAAAARQPAGPAPGRGQYLYTEILLHGVPSPAASVPAGSATARVWLARNGTGREVTRTCDPRCHLGVLLIPGTRSDPLDFAAFGFPLVNPQDAARLPADPAALRSLISGYWQREIPTYRGVLGTADLAGGFLAVVARPAVRAALYRMIEGLPGIQNLGPMTDPLGRHGVGVAVTKDGIRVEIVYDPVTSAVLEERSVAVPAASGRAPARSADSGRFTGTVVSYVVFAVTGLVGSDTAMIPPTVTSG